MNSPSPSSFASIPISPRIYIIPPSFPHQNRSGYSLGGEVGMAKGMRLEFESACHNYCCSVLFSSPSKGSFAPRPQSTPSFWPCVSVKRSMAHFGGTNKRRTHSFSQTIISNCTQILYAPTHTHPKSGSVHLCGNISFVRGSNPSASPFDSIKSVYKRRPNGFNVQRKFSKKQ